MMARIRIVDVTDEPSFRLIPPCADPGFDHRSCDYWEDADRGSKAARLAWFEASSAPPPAPRAPAANPFARDADGPAFNPFAPAGRSAPAFNPFADDDGGPAFNLFAATPSARPSVAADAPRKLALLGRGQAGVLVGGRLRVGGGGRTVSGRPARARLIGGQHPGGDAADRSRRPPDPFVRGDPAVIPRWYRRRGQMPLARDSCR